MLEQQFDTVIVDEISMAQIPQLFVAMGLGKQVIFVGDFLQLPPIVTSKTDFSRKWLGQNLYQYFDIPKSFIQDNAWPNQVLPLFEQYRMHSDISDLINSSVYHNRLKNSEDINSRRSKQSDLKPFVGHVAMFDTWDIGAFCQKKVGGSRFSLKNAALAVFLATTTSSDYYEYQNKQGDFNPEDTEFVGIVAPYRAQANLISKLLSDITISDGNDTLPLAKFTEVNTVHKFQGNQRKVIIFDTTDDYPMYGPAPLVDDGKVDGDDAKLINVAVTRSQDKFLLLGNRKFIEEKHSASSLVRDIFSQINKKHQILDFNNYPNIPLSQQKCITKFENIVIPITYLTSAQYTAKLILTDLLNASIFGSIKQTLTQISRQGIAVEIFTQHSSLYNNAEVEEALTIHRILETDGIKLNLRGKYKETIFLIDEAEIVIFFDEKNQNGLRLYSPKGVSEIIKLYNLGDATEAKPCPKCLKEGRSGVLIPRRGKFGSFLGCALYPKCDFIENEKKISIPKEKISGANDIGKCPKCGNELCHRTGKYGAFIGCSGYPNCRFIQKKGNQNNIREWKSL